MTRLSLWATAGAGKGVLDSDAVYIKAEPILCFKYCLADEGTNGGSLTVTKGVVDLQLKLSFNNGDVTSISVVK